MLVCGGHAVNAYQVIRKTGDLDLVVRERDVPEWRAQLVGLGYEVFHEDPAFLQLSPPTTTGWPIDLVELAEARGIDLPSDAPIPWATATPTSAPTKRPAPCREAMIAPTWTR